MRSRSIEKYCKQCGTTKARTEFYVYSYGISTLCRKCTIQKNTRKNNASYSKHRDKRRKSSLERYHEKKLDKDWLTRRLTKQKQYRKNHRWMWNYHAALERLKPRNQVPKWAQLDAIKQFYKNCPPKMVVDHVIPVTNDLITGLHVLENLQYLTFTQNAKKGNKFQPYIGYEPNITYID